MAITRVNGVVLRYTNYRESDRILTIFTRESGLLSATARGCRRPKSALMPVTELFVFAEFVLFENHGHYSINEATVKESFYPLREDVSRFAAAMAMLTVTEKGATAQKNEALFEALYYALSFTAYGDGHPADMAICFLLHALDSMGFRPALTQCANCGKDLRDVHGLRFYAVQGGACCDAHGFGMPVRPISMEAARRILRLSPEALQKVVLPTDVRVELLRAMGEYAENMLECSIKSLRQV